MNSILCTLKSVCLATLFFSLLASQSSLTAAASKHRASIRSRGRAETAKGGRAGRRRAEARRRAVAARLAAIARERALEDAMRDKVQSMIAKDDATGEDTEVRRVAINALGNHAGTVVV